MSFLRTLSMRQIVVLWVVWITLILGFQAIVHYRYQPDRPDYALSWTPEDTSLRARAKKPYLIDPFMNFQVNMDSEFYLSIAVAGYDDPLIPPVEVGDGQLISKSYAFFPLYPYLIRFVSVPLSIFGQTPIGTASLAGVLVSVFGTLGALFALYDLCRDELGEDGALRSIFYLLIFPSGFFLAQVFTEGLFLGLAFGCLALAHRKHLFWAALLSVFAVWTRAVGVGLGVALALAWWQLLDKPALRGTDRALRQQALLQGAWRGVLVLAPLASYLVWRVALGNQFELVEGNFFGRTLFNWDTLGNSLREIWAIFQLGENTQAIVYYSLEIVSVVGAGIACLLTIKKYPAVAFFGAFAVLIPLTSGAPQSLIRYVLAVPSVFIVLSRLGKNTVFDRSWTTASVLLMGMLLSLHTFNMWVA